MGPLLSWTLAARHARIFTELTDPADLVKWWGQPGFTAPEIELHLTVGGRSRCGDSAIMRRTVRAGLRRGAVFLR